MGRTELESKANTLGIEFDENVNDDDLTLLITEKEKVKEPDDVEYWRTEAKKAFQTRDEIKAERRKLQSKLTELEAKLKDAPDAESIKALKTELVQLKKFKTEFDKKTEEEELKKKTELERMEISFKKQLDSLSSELDRLKNERETEKKKFNEEINKERAEKQSLRVNRLESEIVKFAVKYKALKPEQIVKLLKDDFNYDDQLNKFVFPVKDDKGKLTDELSIEDRVKMFLSDPDNENLIASSANTDGTGVRNYNGGGEVIKTKSTKKYDPKDPDIIKQAYLKGLSVEDHIATLKKMREKLDKVHGIKGE